MSERRPIAVESDSAAEKKSPAKAAASQAAQEKSSQILALVPGTVLPQCNGAPREAGPRAWRLTAKQWENAMKALGAQPNPSGFPADSRAGLFDSDPNGLILRSAHSAFFAEQAQAASSAVTQSLRAATTCARADAGALKNAPCRGEYVRVSLERVFRRPPEAEEVVRYADLFERLVKVESVERATADLTSSLLRSPHFLYRVFAPAASATPARKSFAIASHLSFTLADVPPDEALLAAASAGSLLTKAGLQSQAARLLRTPQGRAKFLDFAEQWLLVKADVGADPARDPQLFADYSAALYRDMLKETDSFLAAEALDGGASIHSLFSSTAGYVTPALEAYYSRKAIPQASNAAARKMDLASSGRQGLLTHASVLVALSQRGKTHALHRANILRSHFLCYALSGPPADALSQANQAPKPVGATTEKMRFEAFVKGARSDCAGCHSTFVPYGLAMENWGADGRFRTMDGTLKIDASGDLPAPDGSKAHFENGADFLTQVASWNATAHCTLLRAHEFHWGSHARPGHSCAIETRGGTSNVDSSLTELYLAPVTDPEFFEAW